MAKGEGAEGGSAAGLLPTGILPAAERPAQVKVRARPRTPPTRAEVWGLGASLDGDVEGEAWFRDALG